MDKDSSGMRGERGTETGDVALVKVGRSSAVDMGVKRECTNEDDTQTLDLTGRKDSLRKLEENQVSLEKLRKKLLKVNKLL